MKTVIWQMTFYETKVYLPVKRINKAYSYLADDMNTVIYKIMKIKVLTFVDFYLLEWDVMLFCYLKNYQSFKVIDRSF